MNTTEECAEEFRNVGSVVPRSLGIKFFDDDRTSWCKWWLFDRAEVEAQVGVLYAQRVIDSARDRRELGCELSQQSMFNNGPGSAFQETPFVTTITKRWILVTAHGGLDI